MFQRANKQTLAWNQYERKLAVTKFIIINAKVTHVKTPSSKIRDVNKFREKFQNN